MSASPQWVELPLLNSGYEIKQVATGKTHSLILMETSRIQLLLGCGSNEFGQLGEFMSTKFEKLNTVLCELPRNRLITKIGCGVSYSAVVVSKPLDVFDGPH